MVFLGGAVLADIMKDQAVRPVAPYARTDSAQSFWVSRDEWAELGTRALDKLGPRTG